MATTERIVPLTGLPAGNPLILTSTSSPGQLIHTVSSSPNDIDRLTLKVSNFGSLAPVTVTFQFGQGATTRDMVIANVGYANGEVTVVHALPLVGSATATTIHAWCSLATTVTVSGDTVRVTQT